MTQSSTPVYRNPLARIWAALSALVARSVTEAVAAEAASSSAIRAVEAYRSADEAIAGLSDPRVRAAFRARLAERLGIDPPPSEEAPPAVALPVPIAPPAAKPVRAIPAVVRPATHAPIESAPIAPARKRGRPRRTEIGPDGTTNGSANGSATGSNGVAHTNPSDIH